MKATLQEVTVWTGQVELAGDDDFEFNEGRLEMQSGNVEDERKVANAIGCVWGVIGVCAATTVANSVQGHATTGTTIFSLAMYALLCWIPVRLGKKSRVARKLFACWMAMTLLILIAGDSKGTDLDKLSYLAVMPLGGWAVAVFFSNAGAAWFGGRSLREVVDMPGRR